MAGDARPTWLDMPRMSDPKPGRAGSDSSPATRWSGCSPALLRAAGSHSPQASSAASVVAALEQLARDQEAGGVAAEACGRFDVVVVIGRRRAAGALGGLKQRPAQRRWALAGEVAGPAAGVDHRPHRLAPASGGEVAQALGVGRRRGVLDELAAVID